MSRNTLLCVLAVLAFGQAVHLKSSTSSLGSSDSAAAMTSSSAASSSASSSGASVSTTISSSASGSPSTSASPSSSPTATTSMSPSPSPKVSSSHNSVSQSATMSGSASSTPSLSSVIKSSSSSRHSTSVLSPSSSHTSPVSPSTTAVVATESVNITDNNNEPCLQARLEVTFNIEYVATVKNETQKENATIPLNGNSTTLTVSGNCSYKTGFAYFQMKWNEYGNITIAQHTFTMNFELGNDSKWRVPNVSATFSTSDRRAFVEKAVNSNITTFGNGTIFGSRKKGKNYLCDAKSKLRMSDNVAAVFQNVVLQPFSKNPALDASGSHCSADNHESGPDDNNTVPIAVGAALGGLVLIVLVAYIIGRRRSSRGYEQV